MCPFHMHCYSGDKENLAYGVLIDLRSQLRKTERFHLLFISLDLNAVPPQHWDKHRGKTMWPKKRGTKPGR